MEGEEVTVSVSISGSEDQRHLGLHVVDGENVLIYHLAWHCFFFKNTDAEYRDRIAPKYMLVPLEHFTPHEMLHIYRHLIAIHSRNGRAIPYGFKYVVDSVLTREGLVPPDLPPGSGLTCSTFVLQVLRNNEFFILDTESWESREGDAAWQAGILAALKEYAPQAHIEALTECVGVAVRFRPEEVAGCARAYEETSILFPEGILLGERVVTEMRDSGTMAS